MLACGADVDIADDPASRRDKGGRVMNAWGFAIDADDADVVSGKSSLQLIQKSGQQAVCQRVNDWQDRGIIVGPALETPPVPASVRSTHWGRSSTAERLTSGPVSAASRAGSAEKAIQVEPFAPPKHFGCLGWHIEPHRQ